MDQKNRLFTEDQVEQANSINILAYARSRGYEIKRKSNHSYKIPGYGGLYINGDGSKWNQFSQDKGGGPIQFVMEMEGKSWVNAVKELLGISHDELPVVPKPKKPEEKGEMVLPKKNDTYKHLFAYLIKTRCIDQDIVTYFVDNKMLYEDVYRNCVFVGLNDKGKAAYASRRSTRTSGTPFKGDVENSDKSWPFHKIGSSDTVCVFEAPIDLMSYLTLVRLHGVGDFKHHMVSLGCLGAVALDRYLKMHTDVSTIIFCLDKDQYASKACKRFYEHYKDNYHMRRHSPKCKDFNEDLIALKAEKNSNRVREPPEQYNDDEELE